MDHVTRPNPKDDDERLIMNNELQRMWKEAVMV
jgi:hypothetical protein